MISIQAKRIIEANRTVKKLEKSSRSMYEDYIFLKRTKGLTWRGYRRHIMEVKRKKKEE